MTGSPRKLKDRRDSGWFTGMKEEKKLTGMKGIKGMESLKQRISN
jgi:hypothetical protein